MVAVQGYVEVYRGPERSARITRLQPGSRYSCWVLASNALGCGPPGQVALCSTKASVPDAPAPPVPLSATQTSITLQWQAPAHHGSPITTFTLERDQGHLPALQPSAPGPGGAFGLAYAGPATQAVVAGLRPGHMYRFRLRADNDEGCSFWSELLVAGTAASAPGPPQGLSSSSVTQSQATVCWGPPLDSGGAPPHSYQVELQALSQPAAEMMGSEWLRIFEGPGTACAINSLRPGCAYRLRLRCANTSGWGSWSQPLQLHTAPDVPDAPGAPAVLEAGATSLRLTWHPPLHNGGARITAYNLQQQTASPSPPSHLPLAPEPSPPDLGGGAAAALLVYCGPEPLALVSPLQPGSTHLFRVQAVNSQGQGQWSEWSAVSTAPDCPAAPAPPQLAAPPSSSTLAVQWEPPACQGAPITSYRLQLAMLGSASASGQAPRALAAAAPESSPQQEGAGGLQWQEVFQGPGSSAQLSGLQPATRYLLRLAAVNAVGPSPWSAPATLSTAPGPPSPPQHCSAAPLSSTQLRLTWQPPATDQGAPLTGYAVDLAPGSTASGHTSPGASLLAAAGPPPASAAWQQVGGAGPGDLQLVLAGLLPGCTYQVRVRALNSCGSSPPSDAPSATTPAAPPGPPTRLTISHKAAGSARVRWEAPLDEHGAAVGEYLVEPPAWPAAPWRAVYRGPDCSARLADLAPGTQYCLRVSAANAAGWGSPCSPESFRTALAPPGPPLCLTATLLPPTASSSAAQGVVMASSGAAAGAVPPAESSLLLCWQAPLQTDCTAPPASYEVQALALGLAGSGAERLGHSPATSLLHDVKLTASRACECLLSRLLLPGLRYGVRVRAVGAEGAGHGAWCEEEVVVELPGCGGGSEPAAGGGRAHSGGRGGRRQGQAGRSQRGGGRQGGQQAGGGGRGAKRRSGQ
ncbi:fibronectin type III [Haematococcus lacustris]